MAVLTLLTIATGGATWSQSRALMSAERDCRDAAGLNAAGSWARRPNAQALAICVDAAVAKHPDVLAFLGRAYYFSAEQWKARFDRLGLRSYSSSQAAGSLVGTALIGIIHKAGFSVRKDDDKAVHSFRKAPVSRNLGIMYARGRGVANDEAQGRGVPSRIAPARYKKH